MYCKRSYVIKKKIIHEAGFGNINVYIIIICLKQKNMFVSFHLQNPVLIRIICNQYIKIMNAVSDTQSYICVYACLLPPPVVFQAVMFYRPGG